MIYRPKGRKLFIVDFTFRGRRIQKRTKATHAKDARAFEAVLRLEMERGGYGLMRPLSSPALSDFLKDDFLPYSESSTAKNTAGYYRYGAKLLLASPLAGLRLDAITGQHAASFAALHSTLAISTINCGLRTLRRAISLAYEWGRLGKKPHISLVRGERQRDRVLTQSEADDYLAACPCPWGDIATLILSTGIRPGEAYPLRWENVLLGQGGLIQIVRGKTKAARRMLPLLPQAQGMLTLRWNAQGRPAEGWIFPSKSRAGHFAQSSAGGQHKRALARLPDIEPFEPYCLRHTFLTRLAESGCDAFTLAKIAGHSSIRMTERYVHPQAEAIGRAFNRLSPTKSPTKA